MSRADDTRRLRLEEDRDREAHARPNEPPTPFDPDPEAWESFCAGNKTSHHLAPTAKLTDRWRCGSCGSWVRPPVTRQRPPEQESQRMAKAKTMNGTIKSLHPEKGFGFILGEDGIEYFFHKSAVTDFDFDTLQHGTAVRFVPGTGQKGPRADQVELV